MDLVQLTEDRFLKKSPSQSDQTKSVIYTAANPVPKKGDDGTAKSGQTNNSTEDAGAPNILTGTVIISCFIQTSALPSRIEMQGNDLTFFDDTFAQNGQTVGDTSRLIFTHGSAKKGEKITEGFIWEKRSSGFNTYDNVLALYGLPPRLGAQNSLYFGLDAHAASTNYCVNYMAFVINHDTNATSNPLANGEFAIAGVTNSARPGFPNFAVIHNSIIQEPGDGYSILLNPTPGVGLIIINGPITPNEDGLDLGDDSDRFGTIFATAINLPGDVTWTTGAGSPNGVVTAPPGSLYSNTSGGASTTLYVKESGAGNTGWVAK